MPTRRLTDQFVERVKPPAKGRISYFDAGFPGLEMRHSQFGHRAFYLLYRMRGDPRLRRLGLGIYPHVKPARARALATEALQQASTPASTLAPNGNAIVGPRPRSIRSTA